MTGNESFHRFVARFPDARRAPFFGRRHFSRRRFFELLGSGVTASYLAGPLRADAVVKEQPVTTRNTARSVIFVLLAGAPSHIDTFDFKEVAGVTPTAFAPETAGGIVWPAGLMPRLKDQLADLAIVRSMRSWALQHNLSQTWAQIARSPAAALGDVAPNVGSVVALEKANERRPTDVFPAFLALNSNSAVGSGYLSAAYSPYKVTPSTAGLPNTTNRDGAARFAQKWDLMSALDAPLRAGSPLGKEVEDYDAFYQAARGLMYNPAVDETFRYSAADAQRYGSSAFGNACLVAAKVVAADRGTRFIQITLGGWDHHQNIYAAANLPRLAKMLDDGLSALLADLKAGGLLNETLIVVMGEFGRTVGRLSAQNGRDHYLQQFAVFAGAGVRGGRAIGSPDERGSAPLEPGWSRGRDIRPEDVEATIYSALGINWTRTRYDDPFGRGFEYIPYASEDLYGPVEELWG